MTSATDIVKRSSITLTPSEGKALLSYIHMVESEYAEGQDDLSMINKRFKELGYKGETMTAMRKLSGNK